MAFLLHMPLVPKSHVFVSLTLQSKFIFSRKSNISWKLFTLLIIIGFFIRTSLIYIFKLDHNNLVDCLLFGIPASLIVIYIKEKVYGPRVSESGNYDTGNYTDKNNIGKALPLAIILVIIMLIETLLLEILLLAIILIKIFLMETLLMELLPLVIILVKILVVETLLMIILLMVIWLMV
jgi:hypothetical protein